MFFFKKVLNEKLHPKDCVIRFCRVCKQPMNLEEYEYDTEYRWYDFHCINCDFTVRLGEAISEDMRELYVENGEVLEPLTKEEIIRQKSPLRKEADKRMFKEMLEGQKKKERAKKLREAHSLDKNDLEKMK